MRINYTTENSLSFETGQSGYPIDLKVLYRGHLADIPPWSQNALGTRLAWSLGLRLLSFLGVVANHQLFFRSWNWIQNVEGWFFQ